MDTSTLYSVLAILFIIWVYFWPTFIAFQKEHSLKKSILIINLFLGFTFVGWVICLAWSFSEDDLTITLK